MMIRAKACRIALRRSIASVAGSRNQSAESAAGLEVFMADEGSSIQTAKTMIFRQPTKEKRGPGFRKSSRPEDRRSERMAWHLSFCHHLRLGISRIDLRADAADLRPFGHQSPRP